MSDFGAGACDFHSDFASDFCTEGNDYASDFCDFPGNYDIGFGREARPHQKPRPAWRDHADSPSQSAPAPQGPATPQSGNLRR